MKKMWTRIVTAVVVSLLITAWAPSASATAQLMLSDGTQTVIVTDGETSDLNPLTGAVTYSGSLGAFLVNVTTGITKPVYDPTSPKMDLNSVNVSVSNSDWATLYIAFTDTDFQYQGPGVGFEAGGHLGAAQGSTVTLAAYQDNLNRAFASPTPVTPLSVGTAAGVNVISLGSFGPGGFKGDAGETFSMSPSYSLTELATVTFAPGTGNTVSFDAMVHTPEPSGMVLFGGLILVTGGLVRRFRRR